MPLIESGKIGVEWDGMDGVGRLEEEGEETRFSFYARIIIMLHQTIVSRIFINLVHVSQA